MMRTASRIGWVAAVLLVVGACGNNGLARNVVTGQPIVTGRTLSLCGDPPMTYTQVEIETLAVAYEAARDSGIPEAVLLAEVVAVCEGVLLESECTTCVVAIIDEVYGP